MWVVLYPLQIWNRQDTVAVPQQRRPRDQSAWMLGEFSGMSRNLLDTTLLYAQFESRNGCHFNYQQGWRISLINRSISTWNPSKDVNKHELDSHSEKQQHQPQESQIHATWLKCWACQSFNHSQLWGCWWNPASTRAYLVVVAYHEIYYQIVSD